MTGDPHAPGIGVFIWGSCVSRDTYSRMTPGTYRLLAYVARQSAISAATPPVTGVAPPRLDSAFQERMVRGDFESNLLPMIKAAATSIDVLLVDLTDERLGVLTVPDGTAITRSNELIASGADRSLREEYAHRTFGSDAHFETWLDAVDAVGRSIRAAAPGLRIVLLDIAWARHFENGEPTPASYGLSAAAGNGLMRRYVDAAAAALRAHVVSLPESAVTADAAHVWGEAPFHYTSATYAKAVTAIERILNTAPQPPRPEG
ncbi:hypothetical protein ET495_10540 [Xylanimonas allomyrinae]|uniref:SGNH/GDSL hydrolase family protein n=1 Tax=Xylanimonas allomyrinae TaxID=2509459 RepID=A0A4P6EMG4_9MICO|nr:DUF6270 domain-containing protein [Xylanimonas allomyrinae]QAY63615.1 hypothetical protein ET495_10540 [Xylanimonas allomyrinae]